jgi:hypothetical protein
MRYASDLCLERLDSEDLDNASRDVLRGRFSSTMTVYEPLHGFSLDLRHHLSSIV